MDAPARAVQPGANPCPTAARHSQLVFSGDGNYLYYARQNADGSSSLYRIPSLGGDPIRVSDAPSRTPRTPHLTMASGSLVHLDTSEWKASIRVANADGSGERVIATRSRPQYFATPVAWSPDGRALICFTGSASSYRLSSFHLSRIRVSDGARNRSLTTGGPGRQAYCGPRPVTPLWWTPPISRMKDCSYGPYPKVGKVSHWQRSEQLRPGFDDLGRKKTACRGSQ